MKFYFLFLIMAVTPKIYSQSLQLHYDFRHSIKPEINPRNYPTLYFEYFKGDSSGSFLLKMQNDYTGEKNNIGQFYMQVSKSMKFWKPNVYLQIQYSGGLGIAEQSKYGYYINNSYSIGISYPFQWKEAWFNTALSYTYNPLKIISNDILGSFYWGYLFWNYRLEFSGNINIWTLNKDQGALNSTASGGKVFYFFGEPQLWFSLNSSFAIGTKMNLYYHVLTAYNQLQLYPTLAVRYKF